MLKHDPWRAPRAQRHRSCKQRTTTATSCRQLLTARVHIACIAPVALGDSTLYRLAVHTDAKSNWKQLQSIFQGGLITAASIKSAIHKVRDAQRYTQELN